MHPQWGRESVRFPVCGLRVRVHQLRQECGWQGLRLALLQLEECGRAEARSSGARIAGVMVHFAFLSGCISLEWLLD